MQMPKILGCDARECSYNQDAQCHALAITVGDGAHPHCDTFWTAPSKGGDLTVIGGVGACRATGCRFNDRLECTAPGVKVGHAGKDVDCLTFAAR